MFIVAKMETIDRVEWKKHCEQPTLQEALEYVNKYNKSITGNRNDAILAVFSESEWAEYNERLQDEIRASNDQWAEDAEDSR